jgi:flagellar basal-body rod modification protein FlgD
MASTTPVSNATSTPGSTSSSSGTGTSGFASNSTLDQSQFLQLLVAQMQAQDPMDSTSNSDFVSQLAQFSTLSGIESLNSNFSQLLSLQEITQGTSLEGHTVTYTNSSNQAETGTADGVVMNNGNFEVQVGSDSVSLSQITAVV